MIFGGTAGIKDRDMKCGATDMECRRSLPVGEPKPAGRAPKVDTIFLDALARKLLRRTFV
jgi:hypothetical protein